MAAKAKTPAEKLSVVVAVRFTPDQAHMLDLIAAHDGLDRAKVISLALREFRARRGQGCRHPLRDPRECGRCGYFPKEVTAVETTADK